MATDLALTKPDPSLTEDSLRVMMAAAQRYVASGLLPGEVNTPQKALLIMTAGRELGVPSTYALRNIHVVKGKPVCSAELMLALVRRSYGQGAIRVAKTSNAACTVQYREQGWDGISEYTFTMDDAKQAGVTGNNNWRAYPAAMLRARCISAVVRFAFPECISGLYTPEEMGAEVVVTDDGHVNVVESTSAPVIRTVLADDLEGIDGLTPQQAAEEAVSQEQATPTVDLIRNADGVPVCQVERYGLMSSDPVQGWDADDDNPERDAEWVAAWQITRDGYGMPLCLGHQLALHRGQIEAVRGRLLTRDEAEAVYAELAIRAADLGHKHAKDLKTTKPGDLSDDVLRVSARKLAKWLDQHEKVAVTA